MPITDIGSYPVVMAEFDDHWGPVNLALGGTPATDLKLEGGFTRANFATLTAAISAKLTGAQSLENARQLAADQRDTQRAALYGRLSQLRGMVRGLLPHTAYVAAIPLLPDISASESKFMAPFDDAADVWSRMNADTTIAGFTPPLTIGAYTQAMFLAEISTIRGTFGAVSAAESAITIDLRERDLLLDTARERMVQYRILVEAMLGPTHPLTLSLPDLYPQPGGTAIPVTLAAVWNGGLVAAVLTWTPSTQTNVAEYEIRMSPGPTYDAGTATVVGNTTPALFSFHTSAGLAATGNVASFKVFVKLATGNEAGSNTATVTRT